ncbi:MAG: lysylphosphatidylglycerol synthase transmembrane domain-containing protein [Candidatus Hadarchaeota archaeon]
MFKRASTVLLACFGVLILGGLIYWANPSLLAETIPKIDLGYLLVAFAFLNCSLLTRAMKWKVLLPSACKISFRSLFLVQVLGVAISNFTPAKVGEPVKAVILKAKEKRAVSETLPSIIWERILDLLALLLLGTVGAVFLLGALGFLRPLILSIGITIEAVLLLLLLLYSRAFGGRVFSLIRKLPALNKRAGNRFLAAFYAQKISVSKKLSSFFLTLFTWFLEGLVLYSISLSFGVVLSPLAVVGVYAVSVLVGVFSFLPGGLGPTELVIATFFGWMGVEKTTGVTVALVTRALTLSYVTALGGGSFVYLRRRFKLALGEKA